jgi:ATP synthase subunit 6
MIASPLEQFEIIPIIPMHFGLLNISFTNSSLFILIVIGIFYSIFNLSTKKSTLIPNRWQTLIENIYEFVLNIINENIGLKGMKYFPLIFTTFIFILFCNLFGMIPYSFTVTSHIVITFGLGLSMFIGITLLGFVKHGIHFFSLFFPAGTPLQLAPLNVSIELVSYISRGFSLSIRLFANMMSGHALLKIIAGFGLAMLTSTGSLMILASLLPIGFIVIITGLEIGIACLQAYVFAVLLCIYLNDAINLH